MISKEGANLKQLVFELVQENPYVKGADLPNLMLEKFGLHLKQSTATCYLTDARKLMGNSPMRTKQVTLEDMQFFMEYMKGMKNGRQKLRAALQVLKPLAKRFDSLSRLGEVMNFCDKAKGLKKDT